MSDVRCACMPRRGKRLPGGRSWATFSSPKRFQLSVAPPQAGSLRPGCSAIRVNAKAAYDAGLITGLIPGGFKGKKHSAESKKKMIGNTNNTREDTEHLYCPNPACRGGADKGPYRTTYNHTTRDFKKHLAKCDACADFVRGAIVAHDPHGVLWGWRPGWKSKWPKWLPPPKKK